MGREGMTGMMSIQAVLQLLQYYGVTDGDILEKVVKLEEIYQRLNQNGRHSDRHPDTINR